MPDPAEARPMPPPPGSVLGTCLASLLICFLQLNRCAAAAAACLLLLLLHAGYCTHTYTWQLSQDHQLRIDCSNAPPDPDDRTTPRQVRLCGSSSSITACKAAIQRIIDTSRVNVRVPLPSSNKELTSQRQLMSKLLTAARSVSSQFDVQCDLRSSSGDLMIRGLLQHVQLAERHLLCVLEDLASGSCTDCIQIGPQHAARLGDSGCKRIAKEHKVQVEVDATGGRIVLTGKLDNVLSAKVMHACCSMRAHACDLLAFSEACAALQQCRQVCCVPVGAWLSSAAFCVACLRNCCSVNYCVNYRVKFVPTVVSATVSTTVSTIVSTVVSAAAPTAVPATVSTVVSNAVSMSIAVSTARGVLHARVCIHWPVCTVQSASTSAVQHRQADGSQQHSSSNTDAAAH